MKILLTNPPTIARSLYGDIFEQVSPGCPPLGLAYIAAVLINKGHDVILRDYSLKNMDIQEAVEDILKEKPDFLGISATTPQYNMAKEIIALVRLRRNSIKTVLGGPHFTALPEKSFKDIKNLDYGIAGEAEYSFLELVEGRSPRDIGGMVFRQNGNIFYKNDFAIVKDLDKLPYPARALLSIKEYIPSPVNYKKLPSTTMITSRGCAGNCDFCIEGNRKDGVRYSSAEKVFEEMSLIKNDFGIMDITIKDDAFMQNRERVFRLCDMIIRKGLKTHWNCMSKIDDALDRKILNIMKLAGCYQIGIGVETFNDNILRSYNKPAEREKASMTARLLKEEKIQSRFFFMIGFPEETEEDVLGTFRFADVLDPDIFQMCVLLPFPGSRLRERYKEEYGFESEDWDSYRGFCPESAPTLTLSISKQDLVRFFYKGYNDFYSRPKRIMKNLWRTTSNLGLRRGIGDILKKSRFLYNVRNQTRG